jgi:hypothetical protein
MWQLQQLVLGLHMAALQILLCCQGAVVKFFAHVPRAPAVGVLHSMCACYMDAAQRAVQHAKAEGKAEGLT